MPRDVAEERKGQEHQGRNRCGSALEQIAADETVEVRAFPDDVLARLKALSLQVIEDLAARDPLAAKVWDSYRTFLGHSRPWQQISEQAYLRTTAL